MINSSNSSSYQQMQLQMQQQFQADPTFQQTLQQQMLSAQNFQQHQQHPLLTRSGQQYYNQKMSQSANKQQQNNLPPPLEGYEQQTDVTHSCIDTEPLKFSNNLIIEHLDLVNFKSKQCTINQNHNHKHCPFYHNAKDRKRPGNFYSVELCEFVERNEQCPYGDNCLKAHNRVEQLYKPDKYKTKFCSYYPGNLQGCDYGAFCSFAHSENDIVIELIHNFEYDDDFYMFHFKTVWCPFNLTAHDKSLCVYAHNWQDFRRKPQIYHYDPIPCQHWKSTDYILNYEDGCPAQESCNMCHGWKELEYHPLNYKTKPCQNGKNCQKGKDCPNFHSPVEKRTISQGISFSMFKYYPKNRIVQGTFKIRQLAQYPINYNNQMQQQQQQMAMSCNSTGSEGNPINNKSWAGKGAPVKGKQNMLAQNIGQFQPYPMQNQYSDILPQMVQAQNYYDNTQNKMANSTELDKIMRVNPQHQHHYSSSSDQNIYSIGFQVSSNQTSDQVQMQQPQLDLGHSKLFASKQGENQGKNLNITPKPELDDNQTGAFDTGANNQNIEQVILDQINNLLSDESTAK